MFAGLRTVIYRVDRLEEARAWYSRVLGLEPYFDQPFYVGFNVGGYELGLDPDTAQGGPGPGGETAYWGVDDAEAAVARLLELGAAEQSPVQEVGDGIKLGAVRDPFGNLLGVIENPNFSLPSQEARG
jgi:catechol 2,3-dioxygenase-like lactoylglutathione lyase family enzyme